jgi:hypothetical protein
MLKSLVLYRIRFQLRSEFALTQNLCCSRQDESVIPHGTTRHRPAILPHDVHSNPACLRSPVDMNIGSGAWRALAANQGRSSARLDAIQHFLDVAA